MKSKTIVIKLGTNAMTCEDGSLNEPLMKDLVRQIAEVQKNNNVLFVSSGAMGAGRRILNKQMVYDDVTSRQLYAVVGQVRLMEIYSKLFSEHGIIIAQVLATREDFDNRTHFLNTKNCIESLFREKIVPILNENDFVCTEELMFTDNDELAGMISNMLFADTMIILSNVDGIFDEHGNVIPEFSFDQEMPLHIQSASKSAFGKGGMQSKFKIAQMVANHGTAVYVTGSSMPNAITEIAAGGHVGTYFIPNKS